jgi:uncharacterized membrane protein
MSPRPRAATLAAAVCALHALATSAWYVVWRGAFAERSADEAMFENILWNAVHGHGLRTAVEGSVPHLAVHFSPVLYVLVPLYALFRSMHVVHFLASALIALAGWVFHRHVARTLDERAAWPAMIAFLMTPTLVLQTFMEFHEQALAVLPLTLLLVAWSDGRRARTLWSALALLSVREDNALLVMALGALGLADAHRRGTGALLLALGAGWLACWHGVFIPLVTGGRLPGVFAETYSTWGSTPGEVVRSALSRPRDVVRHVLSPVPLQYLALLLAPMLGVLPFGSTLVLAALPQLLMVLLADHDARQFQIRMHYSVAPAVVFLFASVATLRRFEAARTGLVGFARRWATVAMMAVVLLLAPGWAVRAMGRLNPYAAQIREVLATLPDTSSVTAPGYLLNHLAARPRFQLGWREELPSTDYIVLEDSSRFFFQGTTVDAFHTPRFDSLLTAGGFAKVLARDGWHVYAREIAIER